MKKSVVLLCFILSTSSIFAQLKFAAKGGINISNASYSAPSGLKEPTIESKTGFYLSGTVEYPINESISFVSGLSFTKRGFKAKSEGNYIAGKKTEVGYSSDYSADYIDIPLSLKYNHNLFGYNFYGIGGLLDGFKVSESSKTSTDPEGFIITSAAKRNSLEGIKSTSAEKSSTEDFFGSSLFSLSLGIGIDIPISSFIIAPEISYNLGLNKVNQPEGTGETKLRDFMIGLAFKF